MEFVFPAAWNHVCGLHEARVARERNFFSRAKRTARFYAHNPKFQSQPTEFVLKLTEFVLQTR